MAKTLKFNADGNSEIIKVSGDLRVHMNGDFGGGTLVIEELSPPVNSWNALADTDNSSPGDFIVELETSTAVRFALSGSTSPDLTVILRGQSLFTND